MTIAHMMRRADCGCLIDGKPVMAGSPMAIQFPQVGNFVQLVIEVGNSCKMHNLADLVDNQDKTILSASLSSRSENSFMEEETDESDLQFSAKWKGLEGNRALAKFWYTLGWDAGSDEAMWGEGKFTRPPDWKPEELTPEEKAELEMAALIGK